MMVTMGSMGGKVTTGASGGGRPGPAPGRRRGGSVRPSQVPRPLFPIPQSRKVRCRSPRTPLPRASLDWAAVYGTLETVPQ
jgi:hypothetical protein